MVDKKHEAIVTLGYEDAQHRQCVRSVPHASRQPLKSVVAINQRGETVRAGLTGCAHGLKNGDFCVFGLKNR